MKLNMNDVVMTPKWIAKDIMDYFPIKGSLFEPCKGNGRFYKLMPKGSIWCEITKGRNFIDYKGPRVDWIITNPPYSTFNLFLTKALKCAKNIIILIPVPKLMASYNKLDEVYRWGSIAEIRYYGSGRNVGFNFGFPVAAFHLIKNKKCKIKISFYKDK